MRKMPHILYIAIIIDLLYASDLINLRLYHLLNKEYDWAISEANIKEVIPMVNF